MPVSQGTGHLCSGGTDQMSLWSWEFATRQQGCQRTRCQYHWTLDTFTMIASKESLWSCGFATFMAKGCQRTRCQYHWTLDTFTMIASKERVYDLGDLRPLWQGCQRTRCQYHWTLDTFTMIASKERVYDLGDLRPLWQKGVKGLDANIAEHWTPLQWWHQRNESPWPWEFATFTVRCHECQGTRCQYSRPLATFGMEVLKEWQLISDHRAYIWPLLLLLSFFCFWCPSSLWHSYTSYRCRLSHHSHCTTQSHLTVQSQFSLHEPKPSDCKDSILTARLKAVWLCKVTIPTAQPRAIWLYKVTVLIARPKAVWVCSHHSHCTTQSRLTAQSHHSHCTTQSCLSVQSSFSLPDPKLSDCAKSPFSLHNPKLSDCSPTLPSPPESQLQSDMQHAVCCLAVSLTAAGKVTWDTVYNPLKQLHQSWDLNPQAVGTSACKPSTIILKVRGTVCNSMLPMSGCIIGKTRHITQGISRSFKCCIHVSNSTWCININTRT